MNTTSKIDTEGKTVMITKDDMILIDGVGVFRRINRDGVMYLQFRDHDKYRSTCRGSRFIDVPLQILVEKINLIQNVNGKNDENTTTSPT